MENYDMQEQLNFLLKKSGMIKNHQELESDKKIVMIYKKSGFHWNCKKS